MVLRNKLGQDSTLAPDDSSTGHADWPGPGGDMALRHQHDLDFDVILTSSGSTGHSGKIPVAVWYLDKYFEFLIRTKENLIIYSRLCKLNLILYQHKKSEKTMRMTTFEGLGSRK